MQENKTAIVTGGAMGIGRAIAEALVKSGATVFIADISEKAHVAASELSKEGRVFAIKCDISDYAQAENAVREALKITGRIDYLINNAAIQDETEFEKVQPEIFKKIIDVNVCGTFNMTHAAAKHMKCGAKIVNVSSVHGTVPRTNKYSYDASKAAIEMMTKEFALALAKKKINVNAIRLGAALTPMNADFITNPEKAKAAIDKIPFKRLPELKEIAEAVMFLLSDGASYMTGSILTFDGGRSL